MTTAQAISNAINGETVLTTSDLEALTTIAAKLSPFKTLETQNSGDDDFKEMAVWQIKKMLLAAFEAGQNSVK